MSKSNHSKSSSSSSIASFKSLNTAPTACLQTDTTKCTYCLNSLGNVSIKCNECSNFYLCLKCFSMSAELGEHKKDHSYYLKSNECFPVFDSENYWTYKEELLLLDLVEQFGLGNWDDIAKNLTNRSPKECEQHYYSYYVYGNLGKHTITSRNKQNKSNGETVEKCAKSPEIQNTILLPPVEMSIEEQRALGYMPLRDDFEREFKNDAECLISNLAITNNQISYLFKEELTKPDDDQIDFDIKLTLVKIYRECLIERQRHKKIAREYGLINNASALINTLNKTSSLNNTNGLGIVSEIHATMPSSGTVGRPKKGKSSNTDKETTDLNEKYKKFAQLVTASEYEALVEVARKQRLLSERLKELNEYRAKGITKLGDIDEYSRQMFEKEKIKQEIKNQKKQTKRMLSYSSPKRLTRFNSLRSPVKGFSPSKRFKVDDQVVDNEDLITEEMGENDENLSDDLFQEKSDDEKIEDSKDTEEDLSSAGAASSVGSGINEVDTNNIVRRLRRLNSRSSQNNSFSSQKTPNSLNLSLKSSREFRNLRSRVPKVSDDEENMDVTLNAEAVSDDEEENFKIRSKKRKVLSSRSSSRSSSLSTSASNNSSDAKAKKENLSFKSISSRTRRSTSERLCALPGYNLLSENEKKLILSIHMKPNDYINIKTLIIKNSLDYCEQMNGHQPLINDQLDLDDSLNENLSKQKPNFSRSKKFIESLKRSCPTYFQIPRASRRRILRFLNDNGWINVA